eukprot:TRINITY_DN303_c0_g3_i5.p1 TRINITY_DN303_c0_g3~~TRINITY_DN303_c0_g3_i5.p1  ORF type:complete len:402 (-),score=51.82 TRINITY_DN303_c0_g3_i5:1404-2609(-)
MTATTPIMLISSFGYFAISLVIWNYILVLSFYPATFLMMVKFLLKRKQNKTNQKANLQQQKDDQQNNVEAQILQTDLKSGRKLVEIDQTPNKVEQYDYCPELSPSDDNRVQSNKEDNNNNTFKPDIIQPYGDNYIRPESEFYEIEKQKQEEIEVPQQEEKIEVHKEKYNLIERFFYQKYSPKLYQFRYAVLLIFFCWFAVTVYFTSQLQAPKEVTQTAPKTNILRKGKDHVLDFHSGKNDNVLKVYMVWGISGINRDTRENKWDSNDKGSTIWDDTFDLSQEEAQQRIYDVCQHLRANYVGGDLVQDEGLDCFMENFKSFVEDTLNATFPLPQNQFFGVMENYTENNLTGKQYLNNHYLGIMDGKVKYIQLTLYGKTYLILQRKEQEPLFEEWEKNNENLQ